MKIRQEYNLPKLKPVNEREYGSLPDTPPGKYAQVDFGENAVSVTVVNNWMNRIIGDLKTPEDQRDTWYIVNPYNAQTPLQLSGLFGPVTIKTVKYRGQFQDGYYDLKGVSRRLNYNRKDEIFYNIDLYSLSII